MDIPVPIKQIHEELMKFLPFIVNNLEKVGSVLEPHATKEFQTVHGGKLAEDRMHTCDAEVL